MALFIKTARKFPPGRDTWRSCYVLHWAIKQNKLPYVVYLLNSGADPNHLDKFGRAPLLYAVHLNQWSVVRDLLAAGADPNPPRKGKMQDVVNIAVRHQAPQMLEMLLRSGSNVNLRSRTGLTPLEYSIYRCNHEQYLFDIIADYGPKPNTIDPKGFTPLTLCVSKHRLKEYARLCEIGADPFLVDRRKGLNSVELIRRYGSSHFRRFLRTQGIWRRGDPIPRHTCNENNVSPLLKGPRAFTNEGIGKGPPKSNRKIYYCWRGTEDKQGGNSDHKGSAETTCQQP